MGFMRSIMDKNASLNFDFSFIDVVYKIDNSIIIGQETMEKNERDTAYRLALEFVCRISNDMLLAGSYISLPDTSKHSLSPVSFVNFAKDNGF